MLCVATNTPFMINNDVLSLYKDSISFGKKSYSTQDDFNQMQYSYVAHYMLYFEMLLSIVVMCLELLV